MKKYILFHFLFITLSYLGFSQNVLLLKNGDKLNGKLEAYSNDTLQFIFQGNNMKFKASEIASVYFDISFLPNKYIENEAIIVKKQSQFGKVFGVITYYFNDNFGDKPDTGAEIYFADSINVPVEHRENSFWYQLQLPTDIVKTMADGSGNYSLNLKPGTYYVLIKSKHRTSLSMEEILGKNKFTKINIQEGVETNLNFSFDKTFLMTK